MSVLVLGDYTSGKKTFQHAFVGVTGYQETHEATTIGLDYKINRVKPRDVDIEYQVRLWNHLGRDRFG